MKLHMPKLKIVVITLTATLAIAAGIATHTNVIAADEKSSADASKPVLTVTTVKPTNAAIAATFSASGNVVAWQEAIIGAEVQGLRLNDIRVNVGDAVRKGQVLAIFAPETVQAELAQSKALVAEAEAALAEAEGNATRAKTLEASGALSLQQITQYTTAAKTAAARLAAAQAMAKVAQLRLGNTQVVAPDAGTISARAATVGAVVQSGQELFRLVRRNRLEWRGEVIASELPKISVGQKVNVITPAGEAVAGVVRVIAPTVDPATRNVQVYVDLAPSRAAKSGMFARGEFALGQTNGLTVPQQALVVRDGFSFVFSVKPDNRVQQMKVQPGRRVGDRIEIREGLTAEIQVVAQGAGFLKDGDLVRVTQAAAPATKAGASSVASPSKK